MARKKFVATALGAAALAVGAQPAAAQEGVTFYTYPCPVPGEVYGPPAQDIICDPPLAFSGFDAWIVGGAGAVMLLGGAGLRRAVRARR
jgi:hypothetical protein